MKNNYSSIEKIAKKQEKRLLKDEEHNLDIILKARNLNLFYDSGKTHALNDINMDIVRNNVTAIIGPSGCGKSSFLRCINRMNDLVDNTSVEGEMIFEDVNIYSKNKRVSKEDKKKLLQLRTKLLRFNANKFFSEKKESLKFQRSSKVNLEQDKLTKLTKEELQKVKVKYNNAKNNLISELKVLENKDSIAVKVARFSRQKKFVDKVTKYDLEVFHKALNLFVEEKDLKRQFSQQKKEIRNHLERKLMEIENKASEKKMRDKNEEVYKHYNKNERYRKILNEYEKQWRISKGWKPSEVRTKIGLVFQKPNPFAKSIFENIAFGLRTHGITDPWLLYLAVEKSLKDAALWVEVKDRLDDSALSLSGGQQQRLCIARAISLRPKILLMDEPTASLDPIATAKIEELIKELRRKYTIIIVTHSMQQATRISDYTAFFYQGDLIESGPTHRLFKTPKEERTRQYITGKFG